MSPRPRLEINKHQHRKIETRRKQEEQLRELESQVGREFILLQGKQRNTATWSHRIKGYTGVVHRQTLLSWIKFDMIAPVPEKPFTYEILDQEDAEA